MKYLCSASGAKDNNKSSIKMNQTHFLPLHADCQNFINADFYSRLTKEFAT